MKLDQKLALQSTAVLGAAAVALGAFGAHGLQDLLLDNGRLQTWETAVFYHLSHTLVLLVLSLSKPWRRLAWLLIAFGVLVFSGSLYVLCLTNITWLGAITPVGGLLLIAGWLSLLKNP